MDTLIILLSFAVLLCFWKRPARWTGFALFWTAWIAVVLLFNHHVTSELPLSF